MTVVFMGNSFESFCQWATEDKKVFKKIGTLIKDIQREPFDGLGKPEPLKHDLSGLWSRRITDEHRLIYRVENDVLAIVSCKFHY